MINSADINMVDNNMIPQALYDFAVKESQAGFYERLQNFSKFLLGASYGI